MLFDTLFYCGLGFSYDFQLWDRFFRFLFFYMRILGLASSRVFLGFGGLDCPCYQFFGAKFVRFGLVLPSRIVALDCGLACRIRYEGLRVRFHDESAGVSDRFEDRRW